MATLVLHEDNGETVNLYYEVIGEGIPLVLIHGWLCNGSFWDNFTCLAEQGYKVIIPDLRGHRNTPLSKKLSIEILANDINQLLISLDVEKAIIVGHSMGGLVTQQFFHSFSEKVIALGLWNTGGQLPFGNGIKGLLYYTSIVIAGLGMALAYPIPGLFSYSLTKGWCFSFYKKGKSPAYQKLKQHVRKMDKKAILKSIGAIRKFHGIPKLKEILVPTMLLHGNNDKFITPKILIKTLERELPNYTSYYIDKAAHFPPNEQPQEVLSKLKEFLGNIKN